MTRQAKVDLLYRSGLRGDLLAAAAAAWQDEEDKPWSRGRQERAGKAAYQAFYEEPGLSVEWEASWRGASPREREQWRRAGEAAARTEER